MATAGRRRSSSARSRSSRRWTASSMRRGPLCGSVREILPELQARIDANSTSDRGVPGRDPRRGPRGCRGAAPPGRARPWPSPRRAVLPAHRSSGSSRTSSRRGALSRMRTLRGARPEPLRRGRSLVAVSWRTARAKVLAHQGQHEEAVAIAEDAATWRLDGGTRGLRADALTELGRVLVMVGRRESSSAPGGRPWACTRRKAIRSAACSSQSSLPIRRRPAAAVPRPASPYGAVCTHVVDM